MLQTQKKAKKRRKIIRDEAGGSGDFSRASSVQKSCLAVLNSAYLMGFRQ